MRKSLLFFISLMFISMSAYSSKLNLSLSDLPSGFGDATYDGTTKTITYPAAWGGKGWWLGDVDYSIYDVVVINFNATDSRLQVVIEYNNAIESTTVGVEAGETTIRAALSAAGKASVKQIYLQKAAAGTVVLTEAYLEGDAPTPNYNLSLASLGSGWSSTYDAASKTITYEGAWGGRGWWIGGTDFSAYKDAIVNFAATTATVKLVVQYGDDSNNDPDVYANAGATSIKVDLDPTKSSNVKQIYLQRESAGTLVLESAYLTPKPTAVVIPTESKMYYSNNMLYLKNIGNVQLFDMNGRLLLNESDVISVDLSSFKSGVYAVRCTIDGISHMDKIIK